MNISHWHIFLNLLPILLSSSLDVLSPWLCYSVAWRPPVLMNTLGATRVKAEACNDALMHCLSAVNHLCKPVWPPCILCPLPVFTLTEHRLSCFRLEQWTEQGSITLTSNAYFILRNTFPNFLLWPVLVLEYFNCYPVWFLDEAKLWDKAIKETENYSDRREVKWGGYMKVYFEVI